MKAIYNKTEEDVKCDLNSLREWLQKQPHLPQNITDKLLENILIRNKFRIEKTKQKIDKYYSLRNVLPEFFTHSKDILEETMKVTAIIPMPTLTDRKERIIVIKFTNPDLEAFDFLNFCNHFVALNTVLIHVDSSVGDRIVADWTNISFGHFTKMYPNIIMKILAAYQEGFSSRLLGIHYINAPSFIDTVLRVLKPILKAKLFERICIHKSLEDLYEIIPRKCLPSDYGGDCKEVEKIQAEWIKEINDRSEWLKEEFSMVSDETKRVGDVYKSDLFGTEGSFKKLNLD